MLEDWAQKMRERRIMINMVGPVHIGWKGITISKKSYQKSPIRSYQNVDKFPIFTYRGSSLSTIFWTLKKSYYAKFVLVSTTYPISTSTDFTIHSNSTSSNFIPMAIKFVLVAIVLVETRRAHNWYLHNWNWHKWAWECES